MIWMHSPQIVQSTMAREQEAGRMNSKIRELKLQLAMVDKRSRIKANLKAHKNDRSFKVNMFCIYTCNLVYTCIEAGCS